MAFSTRTQPSISEINVTPLVDVMLVLLIIFMVTAPILQTGIEVNLPRTRTARAVDPEQRAVITISRDESLFYRSEMIFFEQLGDRLNQDLGDRSQPVFLQADEDVRWKTIVAVIAKIKDSGFDGVNLVTRPMSEGR